MNGTTIAGVIARHHITWAEGEATCACGWNDLAPLFGYHLLGLLIDIADAEEEAATSLDDVSQAPIEAQSDKLSGVELGLRTQSVQIESALPPAIAPQYPDERDERMFAIVRRDGIGATYAAIDRELGVAGSTAYQRFDLLRRYGTLPDDMVPFITARRRRNMHLGLVPVAATEWFPLCMSTEDYSDWRKHNERAGRGRTERPCNDCPLSYALEMRSQNKCNGEPKGAAA